jgi:hypothetical protein
MPSTAKQPPTGSALPSVAGTRKLDLFDTSVARDTGIESGVSIFGIALVQVQLCSFNAVNTVFVWAITSAGFSIWMKCPLSVL